MLSVAFIISHCYNIAVYLWIVRLVLTAFLNIFLTQQPLLVGGDILDRVTPVRKLKRMKEN